MTSRSKKAQKLEAELQGDVGLEIFVDDVETDRDGDWYAVAFETTPDEARALTHLFERLQTDDEFAKRMLQRYRENR